MTPRNIFSATVAAMVLVWSGLAVADEYRTGDYQADEFLGLDLNRAVLSPQPLGPATSFGPGTPDATVDPGSDRPHANAEPTPAPKRVLSNTPTVHPRAERVRHVAPPRLLARTKLPQHHRNPLDAQALDARIQVWPCKSGGICNWKR